MRLIHGLYYDILFQIRHGFYYAYLFISLAYIFILKFIPDSVNEVGTVLVIVTDPSVLGAFFIGAILLLEKSQNCLEAILVTPLKVRDYVLSKILSLSMLSLISSFSITYFGYNGSFNVLYLAIGVLLTSIFFTLIGFIIGIYAKTVNQYFLYSFLTVIFVVPLVDYLGVYENKLFYLFPLKSTLLLIDGAFTSISTIYLIYSIFSLVIWCTMTYFLTIHLFYKEIIFKGGQ